MKVSRAAVPCGTIRAQARLFPYFIHGKTRCPLNRHRLRLVPSEPNLALGLYSLTNVGKHSRLQCLLP